MFRYPAGREMCQDVQIPCMEGGMSRCLDTLQGRRNVKMFRNPAGKEGVKMFYNHCTSISVYTFCMLWNSIWVYQCLRNDRLLV